MAAGDKWSKDELIVACYFYICTDKITIKEKRFLATMFNRTEKSIGAKMDNIARFDYEALSSGRSSLPHGSNMDKIVWNEFHNTPELMIEKAKQIMSNRNVLEEGELYIDCPIECEFSEIGPGVDRDAIVKARLNQNVFRKVVLQASNNKCCVTGIGVRSSLIASHIKPWSNCTSNEKTDIHNALCLNAMHDSLFDKYLMTIDTEDKIFYAPQLKSLMGSEFYTNLIEKYDEIHVNDLNRPSELYIKYHNDMFERKNNVEIKSLD